MLRVSNNGYWKRLFVLEVIFLFLLTYSVDRFEAQKNYTFFAKAIKETLKIENAALRDWKAPAELQKKFPIYFSGYDFDERPVWVVEFGKWDLPTYFEDSNKQKVALVEKYFDQGMNLMHNSPKLWPKNKEDPNAIDEWVFFVDMQDYGFKQLTSPESIRQQVRLASVLQIAGENLGYAVLLNMNFFGETLLNILKPSLGAVFSKFDAFGTNKRIWLPQILKRFPKESLHEWYGGFGNFTPVALYG